MRQVVYFLMALVIAVGASRAFAEVDKHSECMSKQIAEFNLVKDDPTILKIRGDLQVIFSYSAGPAGEVEIADGGMRLFIPFQVTEDICVIKTKDELAKGILKANGTPVETQEEMENNSKFIQELRRIQLPKIHEKISPGYERILPEQFQYYNNNRDIVPDHYNYRGNYPYYDSEIKTID